MTRVIVHAGFHKTGSTSLQGFLADNRAALTPHLTYCGMADSGKAGACARIYGQRRFWWRRMLFRRAFRRFLRGIPDTDLIVLSRESFAGAMPGYRKLGGRRIERYCDAAIPLAQEILRGIRHRFGPTTSVDFLYTLRDRDDWLTSVHGHLLRSIPLTDDLDAFRAGFATPPDLEADANRIARALAPVPVHVAWLEDYADTAEGPAGAVLDLAQVPADLRAGLTPAQHRNAGLPAHVLARFLQINRTGGGRARVKAAKAALLAADRQKP